MVNKLLWKASLIQSTKNSKLRVQRRVVLEKNTLLMQVVENTLEGLYTTKNNWEATYVNL